MRVRARSGDKFFAGMVNENEMLAGRVAGRPPVAPTQRALCVPDVRVARPIRRRGDRQVARLAAFDNGCGVRPDERPSLTLLSPRTLRTGERKANAISASHVRGAPCFCLSPLAGRGEGEGWP